MFEKEYTFYIKDVSFTSKNVELWLNIDIGALIFASKKKLKSRPRFAIV